MASHAILVMWPFKRRFSCEQACYRSRLFFRRTWDHPEAGQARGPHPISTHPFAPTVTPDVTLFPKTKPTRVLPCWAEVGRGNGRRGGDAGVAPSTFHRSKRRGHDKREMALKKMLKRLLA